VSVTDRSRLPVVSSFTSSTPPLSAPFAVGFAVSTLMPERLPLLNA
jgi:hypothetical protein